MRIYEEISAGIGNLLPKKILADLHNRRNEFRIIGKKQAEDQRGCVDQCKDSVESRLVASRPKFENTSKASARK